MAPATVLITETQIHPDAAALLAGHRLVYTGAKVAEDDLVEVCRQERPDAILARYGSITRRVLLASPRLRVVARHGVGMDAIDTAAARSLGIAALPALGSNSQAVAEHTLGMMLAIARQLSWLDQRMHQGHWDKDGYLGTELAGRTLGVVGCGSIGGRVARFALGIGMQVAVCEPYLDASRIPDGAVRVQDIDALIARSDVVTLHCPLDDSTRGLLDESRIGRLRKGAIVINAARAGLLDETAMRARLVSGDIYLGLDCFVDEPLPPDSAWLTTPRTLFTPHVGGTTDRGLRGMAVGAAENIVRHLGLTAAA
ncbi:hydroxyacid dehydrogenase [Xylophilus sp.]|uniref:hydroxyacid dehydrogenase n=1 Tax=Xylophilus sp. TaxID=2653893 RepID=UPI0013B71F81|nr:hydroxyacid dehydrogenase [Xylophilus sp.]KAF1050193.1 MAG: Hydroxypyruvate reductase [Xylophilus sp.]